jgi:hypothetical protein
MLVNILKTTYINMLVYIIAYKNAVTETTMLLLMVVKIIIIS